MGVDAGRGGEAGVRLGERYRLLALRQRGTDDHDVPDARLTRARQHRIAVGVERRIAPPASSTRAIVVAMVVPWVSTERGSVSLIERFRISYRFWRRNLRRFSRTRSKMMIVSFNEYPTIVRTAPTTTRLTSRSR